jgi:hypothetical protein
MAFAFETHVLPILQEMAGDPLAEDYPLRRRTQELGIATHDRVDRLIDLMRDDGYISFLGEQNGMGNWMVVADVRPTPKALKQVDVWPADDERTLYLLRRVADSFDTTAAQIEEAEAGSEQPGKLRAGARALRTVTQEVGVEVVAKVFANLVGG